MTLYLITGVAIPLLGAELLDGGLRGGDEARHHLHSGVGPGLEVHPARGEYWLVPVMVDHQVHPGPGGGIEAVVEGLHVQQHRQPVMFSTEDSLAKRHLQLVLLLLLEVGLTEVNLRKCPRCCVGYCRL